MPQSHVIQRLTLEVSANDQPSAHRLQNELSRWVRSESFLRALSERLDTIVPDDMVLQIPKIEVEAEGIDEATFQKSLIEALVKKISQLTQNQLDVKQIFKPIHLQETIIFYLANGYLPETTSKKNKEEIQDFFKSQETVLDFDFWENVRKKVTSKPQILQRMIVYWGIEKAGLIFCQVLNLKTDLVDWIQAFLQRISIEKKDDNFRKNIRNNIWQAVFENPDAPFLTNEAAFVNHFESQFLVFENKIETRPKSYSQELLAKDESVAEDGFYVENAGLVLITPFFSQLFSALGWTENNHWKTVEYQYLAVSLLAYMSHGQTETFEYDWTLNKMLCGLPIETVIEQNEPLGRDTLAMVDELLKTVIDYWFVLKNTSPDGLRHTFLQRSGKLSPKSEGDGWQLLVEHKTEDILIERIPWGFSVIRLPWMKNILFVEW